MKTIANSEISNVVGDLKLLLDYLVLPILSGLVFCIFGVYVKMEKFIVQVKTPQNLFNT